MLLSTDKIKQIAEELEMGMQVYIHCISRTIHFVHPEMDYNEFDHDDDLSLESYEEKKSLIDIEQNPDDYDIIEPMTSNEAFAIMENFTATIRDKSLQNLLQKTLAQKSPFAKFNNIVNDSAVTDDWYTFKDQAYYNYVSNIVKNMED
jgi:hypothetical protein